MALNYGELNRIKGEISTNLDELTNLFNNFTNLVNENVNNQQVWYGASSQAFKNKWDEFADTKFPEYRRMSAALTASACSNTKPNLHSRIAQTPPSNLFLLPFFSLPLLFVTHRTLTAIYCLFMAIFSAASAENSYYNHHIQKVSQKQ